MLFEAVCVLARQVCEPDIEHESLMRVVIADAQIAFTAWFQADWIAV